MNTVTALVTVTPHILSPHVTYIYYDGSERFVFFVTHFHYRHMAIIRELYKRGIQVSFPYYQEDNAQ